MVDIILAHWVQKKMRLSASGKLDNTINKPSPPIFFFFPSQQAVVIHLLSNYYIFALLSSLNSYRTHWATHFKSEGIFLKLAFMTCWSRMQSLSRTPLSMPYLSSVDNIDLTAWLKSKSNEPIANSFANHLLQYEGKCCNYHLTFHFNWFLN